MQNYRSVSYTHLDVYKRQVSTVSGEVLDKSPESNLGKTFAGRFSGMITMETDAELGQGSTSSNSNAITLLVRGLSTINGTNPVSYTHLDVYKRQIIACRGLLPLLHVCILGNLPSCVIRLS